MYSIDNKISGFLISLFVEKETTVSMSSERKHKIGECQCSFNEVFKIELQPVTFLLNQ